MRMLEGGPFDGEQVDFDAHIVRMPLPVPVESFVADDFPSPTLNYVEYERAGNVYRFTGLIRDAQSQMNISAEAFHEPAIRREARRMARRALERLDPVKEVDRIVWVLALNNAQFMWTMVAVVGGRRSDHAAHIRNRLRSGIPL